MPEAKRAGRPPTTIDGQSIQERIVDAAARLFGARGYPATSTRDVAQAAGVTKGALYHYYNTKDDLLYALYADVLQVQMDHLVAIASKDLPADQRIRAAAADIVTTSAHQLHQSAIFFQSLSMLGPENQRRMRRERRRYHEVFRAMIVEAQQDGTVRADVDPDLAIAYFFGSVHHLTMWYRLDGPHPPEQLGETYADFFMRSLRTDPA